MSSENDDRRRRAEAEALRLNTLERFEKGEKSRLVLEEHSHCEVPAGCGGAVLRWRDPERGTVLVLELQAPGPTAIYLDGEELRTGWVQLTPGEHLLALRIAPLPAEASEDARALPDALLFAATVQIDGQPAWQRPPFEPLISREDGSWRASVTEPDGEAWREELGYDDSGWTALAWNRELEVPEDMRWHFDEFTGRGAQALALPGRRPVWIRKRFTLAEQP